MVFEPRDGIFKTICTDALASPARNFYLIIDEINRGDLPRIFGELLTSIELDKRGQPVLLPATGKTFVVPANVFMIGTMNTADRSISLLDTAFRRRFGFVELMPDSTALGQREVGGVRLGAWLDALNLRIRKHLRRDARNLQVGHAYLMPQQPIVSLSEFARVLRDEIIPLLEEYCYDDFGTLERILGKALVDADGGRIKEDIFEAHQEDAFLQAISFSEMESSTLSQPGDGLPAPEGTGAADDEAGDVEP
jgi:5-methylcytosine-specific restriction protein B